jgi:very-short-patch-repair endonuclease/predicted transcriptional regulator of viral defense system
MPRGMDADRVIQKLAKANNRVVTFRALKAAEIPPDLICRRAASGYLHRLHHGVYLLDPPERASRITLMTAAVDACGPGAVLSHRSAAELLGLLPEQRGYIEVTVVAHNAGDRPGIRRHRVPALDPADIRIRSGIPVTSRARTVLDAASYLRGGELEELVAAAMSKGQTNAQDIEAAIARRPSRRGVARLRALLRQDGGPRWTRSWAERRILALVRQARLPVPITNTMLLGFQVDAIWPDLKLVVEVDGYEFHGDRDSFENDRARDAALIAAGYTVIRFTATQLDEQPMLVISRLSAALARASVANARTNAA